MKNRLFILLLLLLFSCGNSSKNSNADIIVVNEKHKFEISPCEYKYNGKVFRLGGDIQELINVFGPYDRYIDGAVAYVWDSIGVGVLCHHKTEKTVELTICFDCCEWIKDDEIESTLPFKCFEGGILVDGVLFGNGKKMNVFKKELEDSGSVILLGFWDIMKQYNYEFDCEFDIEKSKSFYDMNHTFIIRPRTEFKYSIFTIADSREDRRLEMEEKNNKNEKLR